MTASADSAAVRSAHSDSWYPPPSCSAFHGRSGSSEWLVMTWGTPYVSCASRPARFAYHVWVWTTSAPSTPAAMARSTLNVSSAARCGASPDSSGHGR